MSVILLAKKILRKRYLCDPCLGRQFGQLLTGQTNARRGSALRLALALEYEARPFRIALSNFSGILFRKPVQIAKTGPCWLCGGLFDRLGGLVQQVRTKTKTLGFETFMVGTRPSQIQTEREEELWSETGQRWAEPLRAEVNRELGKILERLLGKRVDERDPDIEILLDLNQGTVSVRPNPLYIYGEYKKLVRGISQSKWEKYPESVEVIIARPFMKATRAVGHGLSAAGREDVDARCLDWRPFVLALERPKKRKVDFKKLEAAINKGGKVKVRYLRRSSKGEVRRVKALRLDKTYRVRITFERELQDLEVLKDLCGTIAQRTPSRVLHRRADKLRKRAVKELVWKRIGQRGLVLIVRAEAGLYIKELISGDRGRTKPSVAELLNNKPKDIALDVIKIWRK